MNLSVSVAASEETAGQLAHALDDFVLCLAVRLFDRKAGGAC